MKKILFIALLPVILIACEKEENTNEMFRTPDCTDTTDDGIFEKYTTSEEATFLRFYSSIPEKEVADAVPYIAMSSRTLYNASPIYDPLLLFKLNQKAQLFVYMPYTTGKYYSWTNIYSNTTDTLSVAIYNVRSMNLTAGCYRLYYIFSDSTYTDTSYGKVLTKGHFDFEIKN